MTPSLLRAALLITTTLGLAACASSGAGRAISGPAVASDPAPATSEGAAASSPQVGLDIGQRAPAFSVAGLDGRQVSDVDLRAQGKPYILYFYATW